MLIVCICSSSCVLGNKLDSLNNLIYSSTSDDRTLELILEILDTEEGNTEVLIIEYQPKISEICNKGKAKDCNSRFYNAAIKRLIHEGNLDAATEVATTWLAMSERNNNQKEKAFSRFYLATVHRERGENEAFLSNITISKHILQDLPAERKWLCEVDNILATYYRDIGDFEKARLLLVKGIADATAIEDSLMLSAIYNSLGRLYRKKTVNDSARIFYLKSLEINEKLNNKKAIAVNSNNVGNIYHIEGSYEKALAYYIQSKNVKEELNYPKGLCISYHNIGTVRLDLKQYDMALQDFEKSLSLAIDLDYKILQIHNYLKIGNAYRNLEKIDIAIKKHITARRIASEINFEEGLIESNIYLGEDYLAKKSYKKAYSYFKISLNLAEKNNRKNFISSSLIYIAQCYMEFQSNQDNELYNPENSISSENNIEELLLRGVTLAKEIDSYENMIISLEALRQFYKESGDYKREAETAEVYLIYRDSIYEKQSANAIAKWSSKYESAEKEKEIALLQKENELQQLITQSNRNKFIGGLLMIAIIAFAFLLTMFLGNKVKRARQIGDLRTKISSDLHDDVGSILSGLSMQAELLEMSLPDVDKPKLQFIAKLGRSAMHRMRDAVWAMDARKDSMNDLLDRMKEFAHESLGVKGIEYEFVIQNIKLDKKIRPDHRQNIYLIFKEALTNIIKHSNATSVKLNILNQKDTFYLQIIDNGVVETKAYKTTGLGTANMKMRAKKMTAQIAFKIENGFGVYVKMPSL